MFETVAISTPAPPGLPAVVGSYFSSSSGVKRWTFPAGTLPPGIGSFMLMETPKRERVVRIEANVTTLLYGKEHKYASLHADDVPAALRSLLHHARALMPALPDDLDAWRVRRYDPSATFDVGRQTRQVLDSAHDSWNVARSRRQSVDTFGSAGTVTWRQTRHRSWSAYDKTREHGEDAPPGLLRLEARRIIKEHLTMADLEQKMADDAEIEQLIDSMTAVAAETAMQTVHHLMRGGAGLNEALRLSTASTLLAHYGDHALENEGMTRVTAYRTRKRIRELLATAGDLPEPEAGSTILRASEQVYARDIA